MDMDKQIWSRQKMVTARKKQSWIQTHVRARGMINHRKGYCDPHQEPRMCNSEDNSKPKRIQSSKNNHAYAEN